MTHTFASIGANVREFVRESIFNSDGCSFSRLLFYVSLVKTASFQPTIFIITGGTRKRDRDARPNYDQLSKAEEEPVLPRMELSTGGQTTKG